MSTLVVLPAVISFAVSAALGPVVIPFLKRLKAGQTERDDGPESHLKKNGTTPPKAPSYQADTKEVTGWRCSVCGYILESETLPPDFICPVCGKDASYFVKL